jgi:hypothetical protein
MKRLILMLVVACWLAPASGSAEYYAYKTESGTMAFTDDPEQIPARYREQAELQQDLALQDYERTSIVVRTPDYPDELPALYDTEHPAAPKARPHEVVSVEVDEGISLEVPLNADADEQPIVVETGIIGSDGRGTAERTLVKRGDKVLLEVKKPLFNWVEP